MESKVFSIFCDESRQSEHRFMVLGGLVIDQKEIERFEATMQNFRKETKMFAELKWQKVSKQKLNEYKRFIDFFFSLNNSDIVHFHCIIIDNHQVNHKKFNKGNKELGFYKFYYQLLLHCFGRNYADQKYQNRLLVHLDYRTSSYKLGTLKVILNRGMEKRFKLTYQPFVNVEPMDSKNSELLQINDLILGAVGYQKNGLDLLAGSNEAKIILARYIAQKAGLTNLSDDTKWNQKRFKIWNFKLSQ